LKDHRLGSKEHFSFVVWGETRPTLPRMQFSAVTRQIMWEIGLLRPAFVLFTGDAVWGYGDSRQEFVNELDRWRALADTTDVPFYNAPGNHEMQSEQEAIAILQEQGHDLYGSFDVGRYHFIALNTDLWWKEGRVEGEQLAWLREDLEAHADATGIFVFMHRPMFSWFQGDFNPDDRDDLEALFRTHPVQAVFASHDHFFIEQERYGIRYITSGGGGAPTYTQPQHGGFSHYVLVTLGSSEVEYKVIEPFRLEVVTVRGNDGLQPVSTVRVANATDGDLVLRNVSLRAPRLAQRDDYRLAVDWETWDRQPGEASGSIVQITDTNDGSVTARVEVAVPSGAAFDVTLEARE
jgi:3',5'-cyclic AMP phosphodiesterase CpdA